MAVPVAGEVEAVFVVHREDRGILKSLFPNSANRSLWHLEREGHAETSCGAYGLTGDERRRPASETLSEAWCGYCRAELKARW